MALVYALGMGARAGCVSVVNTVFLRLDFMLSKPGLQLFVVFLPAIIVRLVP